MVFSQRSASKSSCGIERPRVCAHVEYRQQLRERCSETRLDDERHDSIDRSRDRIRSDTRHDSIDRSRDQIRSDTCGRFQNFHEFEAGQRDVFRKLYADVTIGANEYCFLIKHVLRLHFSQRTNCIIRRAFIGFRVRKWRFY